MKPCWYSVRAAGVGTCCVLLAKIAGAEVIVCASTEDKLQRLEALGADHGINYTRHQLHQVGARAIREAVSAVLRWRREYGGQLHRRRDLGPVHESAEAWRSHADLRRNRGLRPQDRSPLHLDVRATNSRFQLLDGRRSDRADGVLIRSGAMKPVIDKVLTLEESAEGVRLIEDREVFGKIIIEP